MPDSTGVHVAGVIVRLMTAGARAAVVRVPGLELHVESRDGRRLVVTLEGDTATALQATHEALLGIPGVMAADLVCHLADGVDRVPAEAGGP